MQRCFMCVAIPNEINFSHSDPIPSNRCHSIWLCQASAKQLTRQFARAHLPNTQCLCTLNVRFGARRTCEWQKLICWPFIVRIKNWRQQANPFTHALSLKFPTSSRYFLNFLLHDVSTAPACTLDWLAAAAVFLNSYPQLMKLFKNKTNFVYILSRYSCSSVRCCRFYYFFSFPINYLFRWIGFSLSRNST